jgi:hypothetical protein
MRIRDGKIRVRDKHSGSLTMCVGVGGRSTHFFQYHVSISIYLRVRCLTLSCFYKDLKKCVHFRLPIILELVPTRGWYM